MQHVLVLNASYEPLNVCSVRRAHVLVWKGKAEILESLPKALHSATDTYLWPHVIRLVKYVRVPRAIQRKISRRALFARDGWRCVYCGTSSARLTLDHVIPRSRGGESVWENVVTACSPVQPAQGKPLARGERPDAASGSAAAGTRPLHPPRDTGDPLRVAAVPAARIDGRGVACPTPAPFVERRTRGRRATSGWPCPGRSSCSTRRSATAGPGWATTPRCCRLPTASASSSAALLELPIEDDDGYFGYGTWIEVGREEFEALGSLWNDDEGWRSDPFPGTLANELSPFAATEGLPVRIQLRDVQLLPLVELEDADHDLVEAQQHGISVHRVHELAATVA